MQKFDLPFLFYVLPFVIVWGAGGGGSPGEHEAGGVRETGEERAGRGREIKKGKLSLFVTAYIQSKKRTQQRFLTFI